MEKREIAIGKRIRNLLLLIFLLLALVMDYCIYQYQKGLSEAKDGSYQEDQKTFDEMNILLVGSDSRGEEHSRADILMIAHYNQNTYNMKIASIMRDTYVHIPGHGMQKINAAYAFGGPELVRKTIAKNFEVDVYYYAVIDFKGSSKLADIMAPKGNEVDIPYKMSYGIGTTL